MGTPLTRSGGPTERKGRTRSPLAGRVYIERNLRTRLRARVHSSSGGRVSGNQSTTGRRVPATRDRIFSGSIRFEGARVPCRRVRGINRTINRSTAPSIERFDKQKGKSEDTERRGGIFVRRGELTAITLYGPQSRRGAPFERQLSPRFMAVQTFEETARRQLLSLGSGSKRSLRLRNDNQLP